MKNRKIVAVIAGGNSSEDVVSFKSAAQVFGAIDRSLFEPYLVVMKGTTWVVRPQEGSDELAPVDLNDFSFTNRQGNRVRMEYALIMIHGTPGENGVLQGYFEMMGIPYSTCDVETSALTFNKSLCKKIVAGEKGIHLAREILIRRGDEIPSADDIVRQLALPLFVKPNASGSSFGVTKVKEASNLLPAIEKAFEESDEVLLEQFIEGREFSCGMMVIDGKEWILPVTELITDNEFFDFEAKYTDGKCNEVTPADLPAELVKELNIATASAYYALKCRGVVRVDFIIHKKTNVPYFIEVNTTPGMSANSIVPAQWREAGLTMTEAFTMIINETTKK